MNGSSLGKYDPCNAAKISEIQNVMLSKSWLKVSLGSFNLHVHFSTILKLVGEEV